jgi:hypothetical protein
LTDPPPGVRICYDVCSVSAITFFLSQLKDNANSAPENGFGLQESPIIIKIIIIATLIEPCCLNCL